MKRLIILINFGLLFSMASGQTDVKISDASGNLLPGAHVTYTSISSGSGMTILTDLDGIAKIPKEFTDKNNRFLLSVNYVGFEKYSDTLDNSNNFSIKLKESKVVLNQLVVTGQYSPNNPEKSIHKIKIIDKEQMSSRGVVTLNDALQFETNMRISQDNMLGSSVSVQGISGENVKIMIDGVPIVGRQDGNIDLNQINLNNIERIEIVEGPLSVNYGTNALAGTINLITKKSSENTYNAGVNSYYESVGQYNIDGALGFQKGKHFVQLTGGRNFFDGWSENEEFTVMPKSRPADTNRNLQWNPKEQYFFGGQYTFRHNKHSFRLFTDYFHEEIINRGSPRAPYNLTAFDEYYITNRYNIGTDVNGNIGDNMNYSFLASTNFYERSRYTYFKDLTNLNEELTNDPSDHDTTNIFSWMSRGAIRNISTASKINWELGYDFNVETASGKRVEDNVQSMGDYAFFTTAEWRPNQNVTVKPGIRYAYNTLYQAPLIPSINFKWAKNKYSVRASYAQGFRAPTIKELYFEFVDINHNIYGNKDLLAETSHNIQLDFSYKIAMGQKLSSVGMGVFYNDINNMITMAQVKNSVNYSYINIGEFKSQGIDLNANQSFNHWRLSVGYVLTGRQSSIDDLSVKTDMFLSSEFRTVLTREFKKVGGNLSAYYKYTGEIPSYSIDENGVLSEIRTAAYEMIDLTATKYLFKKKIHWSFGIKNLLDVKNLTTGSTTGGIHNSSSGSVPISWGRTFFTSIKFNIGWN